MGQDDRPVEPGDGIEDRLASLEARVADLTAEIAALRGPDAARMSTPATVPTPRMPPLPTAPPAPPLPATPPPAPPSPPFPRGATGPWVAPGGARNPAGAPPLGAGWARFVPGARPDPGLAEWAPPMATPDDVPEPRRAPPRAPQPVRPRITFAELEDRLTGRLLAYVGGTAVLLGAVLFLSLAFTRGWIDPAGRVAIGLVGAAIVFGLGAWLFETRPHQAVVATVLVGVGLGVGTVSIAGATRLYDLVPVELGLIGSLGLGIAAAIVAIRVDSRVVGLFGLLAVLAAPPVLGASPGPVAAALVATTLVGTTIVALQRSWRWFPGLAFALSAPQLASWIAGDAPVSIGLGAVAAFWFIHAIAAGGEELLRPTDRLRDSSATLLVADAAFLVWGGFVLLDGSAADWRAPFLVWVALAHGVLAALCIVRQGDRHPFGLLVAGTGVAALTMAVPIQFQGSAVVVAWVAEGAVLAWLSAQRQHLHAGLAAATLGTLAIGHFLLVDAPVISIGDGATTGIPFLDPVGTTLAFMLGGLAVAAWFLRDIRIRVTLAVIGILLLTYALPFELSGLALVGGWSILGVLGVVLERSGLVPPWPDAPAVATTEPEGIPEPRAGLAVAGLLPLVLAITHVALVELPFDRIGHAVRPAIPFTDAGAIGAAILVMAILAMGAASGRWGTRIGVLIAGAIVTYALPFEIPLEWVVIGWAAMAAAGYVVVRIDPPAEPLGLSAGLVLTSLGLIAAFVLLDPPDRLVLTDAAIRAPLLGYVAVGALAGALAAGGSAGSLRPFRPWPFMAAGGLLVYVMSVAIVDVFASRIGGATATEELAKQAQVAMSVAWTLTGAITFAVALVQRVGPARQAGLGLLALATGKVFLLDLASLDVAYRVLSLVGLGLLLLGSAYAYQRLRPGPVASP